MEIGLLWEPTTTAGAIAAAASSPTRSPDSAGRKGASFWASWFSVICTMVGTGILDLPYTLRQGGWVAAGFIVLIAAMANYTGKVLVAALWEPGGGGRRLGSYAALGEAAFGSPGRLAVHVLQKGVLFGVAAIYIIVSAGFLLEGIGGGGSGLMPHLGGADDADSWRTTWTLVSTAVVWVPVVGVHTLGEIGAVTCLGAVASALTVLATVGISLAVHPVSAASADADHSGGSLPLPAEFVHSNATAVGHAAVNTEQLAEAFVSIVVSFGGHSCFPSLEQGMASPADFARVLDFAFAAMLGMYLLTACVGYGVFGDQTAAPILSNFPDHVQRGSLGAGVCVIKLIVAVSIYCSYPILMNVLVLELETGLNIVPPSAASGGDLQVTEVPPGDAGRRWRYLAQRTLLRSLCVGLSALAATLVPDFSTFMGLVGSFFVCFVVFVLPIVCDWRLRLLRGERVERWRWLIGGVIAGIGAVVGVVGAVKIVRGMV